MHEIDGIRISDVGYDKVCLNCRYWKANVQINGPAQGVICIKGHGHTNPNDSCSMFLPNTSVDNLDLNRHDDKKGKMDIWKRF